MMEINSESLASDGARKRSNCGSLPDYFGTESFKFQINVIYLNMELSSLIIISLFSFV